MMNTKPRAATGALVLAAASVTVLLSAAPAARAQKAAAAPKPLLASGPLTLGFESWTRIESRSEPDFSASSANDPIEQQTRLRLNVGWKPAGSAFSAFLQPQYGSRRASRTGAANVAQEETVIHQGYVDWARSSLGRLRVGRQEMVLGDSRLIGNGSWGAFARSFDAVRFTRTFAGTGTTVDVFAGKLGHVINKTNNPTAAGVYATKARGKSASTDLYLLYKGDTVSGRSQDVWTVGTRPKFAFGKGFDATVEAAYQTGRVASRDLEAYAYVANVGYTLPGRAGVRIAVEHDYASGGNPSGTGDLRTFDQLFATNHSQYGTIDYVGLRNLSAWRLSLRAKPTARWNVALDGHLFRLADARDSWYGDNLRPVRGANGQPLRDPSGAAGRDLGTEFDLNATYLSSKNVTFSGGYSRFAPGGFVKRTNAGSADASDWFFFQTNYSY